MEITQIAYIFVMGVHFISCKGFEENHFGYGQILNSFLTQSTNEIFFYNEKLDDNDLITLSEIVENKFWLNQWIGSIAPDVGQGGIHKPCGRRVGEGLPKKPCLSIWAGGSQG